MRSYPIPSDTILTYIPQRTVAIVDADRILGLTLVHTFELETRVTIVRDKEFKGLIRLTLHIERELAIEVSKLWLKATPQLAVVSNGSIPNSSDRLFPGT